MKIKSLLRGKNILGLIVFAILFVLILLYFKSMGAFQREYKYVFIKNNIQSEQIKSKIYLAAINCDDIYYKISNITRQDLNQCSKYSIKYGDEVLVPQNIELEENNESKIVLCTFNTNEAKRNNIVDFIAYLNDTGVRYQQEKTGILYYSDIEFLFEYTSKYGMGIAFYDKIMIIPINGNVCFFVATQYVS